MNEDRRDKTQDAALNPALKRETETVYDTKHRTPAPFDTASAKEGQGEGWPWIWLAVTVLGVALAIYFLL